MTTAIMVTAENGAITTDNTPLAVEPVKSQWLRYNFE